jgi:hypothetical protein
MMSKTIIAEVGAEYDPEHNTLKLDEPLTGIKGRVRLRIETESEAPAEPERPWMELRGCLPPEVAEDWRRAIEEAAAPDPDEI